ncbi:cytochrome c oxidase assembly protein [Eoetvoesiella caeni]|uniref:Putative membrane protein n=1 Tax=Eoetvoesiella caeni TaxID=645616 RepID=A0A366HCF8_9BURK|nr:cytochrome c oxidase assembly protein [Eoetvoesiella caeni]MCI2809309.1 cytochrome c oxidase assembly protein [Eoetvoesiella caeni]NYT54449.1 cytochrome c oxidase assembly protein [Eoetvoesiella caeni]RBP39363.1 putative membrane protein [Eoetvoesiella caeni]
MDLIGWLTPWEFSPALLSMFFVAAVLYVRGVRVHRVGMARQGLFWVGLVLLYLSLHTRVDYYAERLFFAHRIQHLVLHHLGPLLIMGAYPGQVLRAGLPMPLRIRLRDFCRTGAGRLVIGLLTNKYFVPFLFVFLVLVWLIPSVQFYSMLDWRLYRLMNWSVVISGFMYWNLILDRRPSPPAVMAPGARILSPVITMVPQMVVGAVITFTEYDLYPVFDLCGRAIPGMSAVTDQGIGGLTMWVLAGFIETFGLLFALGTMMRLSGKGRLPDKRRRRAEAPKQAATQGV